MLVKEAMTAAAIVITPESPVTEAAKIMRDDDVGFLPVGEDGKLLGTITDRDITVRGVANAADMQALPVRQVMSPELVYCLEDQDVGEAAALMADNQVRRLPVVNSEKQLVGVLSLGDIAVGTEHAGLSGATVEAVSREAI
ncbi:MAG: CBS domain-containing protein [Alphaproteobacteria bacterium]|jgi:CBS domain-containing protein|nr:CBS domain-containing protein [Alphaproteobacteria bacterium]